MVIDTDVLIWYMRGDQNAYKLIESLRGFSISVVTYIELVQGMRNKREFKSLQNALKIWQARILHANEGISFRTMIYIEKYFLSHAITLADAMIGATAVHHRLPLVTGNLIHYSTIKELTIKKFEPTA